MKAAHAGLLVLGAALAGALAIEMTRPQPLPSVAPARVPEAAPLQPVEALPTPASAVAATAKRAPVSRPVSVQVTSSEPEVYVESVRPVIRKNELPPVEDPSALFVPPTPYPNPPVSAATPAAAVAPAAQPTPAPRRVTLQTGTTLSVRLMESLSSDRNVAGDSFKAALTEPLVVDGLVIAERGASAGGRVVDAQRDGRLQLELASISTADGQKVAISTDPWNSIRATTLRGIIEAIAGGRPLGIPPDTVVRFRLATRVTITERRL